MASSSIPYFDVATSAVERGLTCKGCQILVQTHDRATKPRGAVYSRQGFLEHFQVCSAAKELWVTSKGGTAPSEGPFAAGMDRFLLGADPEPLWGQRIDWWRVTGGQILAARYKARRGCCSDRDT
ncbi:hypothetical protein IMZ48_14145 [Candidatus Bathyarchaeota archaeon]|nr:hypothetical protein [Candidatus Bathyarchaeota archaeon]